MISLVTEPAEIQTTGESLTTVPQQNEGMPSDPIRVCHVSMTLKTGGLERLLVEYGRLSDRTKFEVSYLALDELGAPAEELLSEGFPVESLRMKELGKWRTIRRLAQLFRQRRIDIVHTHNTYAQFYGTLAAAWAGVPVRLATQHSRGCGPQPRSITQFKLANWFTTRVFAVSEDSARVCRMQDHRHAGKIDCLRNGIDLSRFAFHGPREQPVAISVCRLSPEKDVATLLRATALVCQQHPQFRLLIVGAGEERTALQQLAADLQLTEKVEFLGERRDIPQLLAQAGFFVASSKTEGISLTLLEAMAVGLPIVATRVGGNPETVEHGVTGLLVPSEQPSLLAEAMLEMLSRPHDWQSMALAARQRVERLFDIGHAIHHYQSLYQELLQGKRRIA